MTSPRKLAQHGDRKKGDDDDGGGGGDVDERAALVAAIDLRESNPGHRTFVFSRFALLRDEHATRARARTHMRCPIRTKISLPVAQKYSAVSSQDNLIRINFRLFTPAFFLSFSRKSSEETTLFVIPAFHAQKMCDTK